MKTAMASIKDMVDVNTILGDPVETPDGTVIVPVSRVTFGFAAGGSEFDSNGRSRERERDKEKEGADKMPFGGGSGAGITLNPVGFLTVGKGDPRFVPVGGNAMVDRILEAAPGLIDKLEEMIKGRGSGTSVH